MKSYLTDKQVKEIYYNVVGDSIANGELNYIKDLMNLAVEAAIDEPDVKWDALYTTPQQPQSVADVLEEVLKILDGHIDRATTLGQQEEFREAQARIRALIKRNTEESE